MTLPSNIYFFPLLGAMAVGLLGVMGSRPKKTKVAEASAIYNGVDKPFDNNISNLMYQLSFSKPYVWFIPETSIHPKAVARNSVIAKAELTKKLDYRSFTVLQTSLLAFALVMTLISYLLLQQGDFVVRVFFNISMEDGSNMNIVAVFTGVLFLLLALAPNIYINSVANKKSDAFISDLPLLQLFLILMIRSKRPVGEMLYTLSKTESRYRNIFSTGYRIFLRDKDAGFNYLESAFGRTSFRDSINVLATCEEYSRDYSAESLTSKLPTLLDDVAAIKKGKGVLRGLLSEGSIALPFVAVMLLGVGPILFSVMKSMDSIFSF